MTVIGKMPRRHFTSQKGHSSMTHRTLQDAKFAELSREEMAQVRGGDNSHGTHVAGTIGAVGNNLVTVGH